MGKYWYAYAGGGPQNYLSILQTYNYYKVSPSFSSGFSGNGNKISMIYASGTTSSVNPIPLSTRIQTYIVFGFTTQLAQPGTTDKKYVYLTT